jgi:hypothetical protein
MAGNAGLDAGAKRLAPLRRDASSKTQTSRVAGAHKYGGSEGDRCSQR